MRVLPPTLPGLLCSTYLHVFLYTSKTPTLGAKARKNSLSCEQPIGRVRFCCCSCCCCWSDAVATCEHLPFLLFSSPFFREPCAGKRTKAAFAPPPRSFSFSLPLCNPLAFLACKPRVQSDQTSAIYLKGARRAAQSRASVLP